MQRHTIFLLFLLISAIEFPGWLQAQNTPVQLVVQVRPPDPIKLSELIINNKLSVYVLLKDLNQAGLDVYFRWTLQGPNLTLTEPANANTSRLFRLSSGLTMFEGAALDHLLGLTSQAGPNALPGGLYKLTINVVEANFGRAVSAPVMTIINLSGNLPPIVNYPAESMPVRYANPQNFAIQWLPRVTNASLRQRLTYKVQLFELRPSNYDPNFAVQSQKPIVDELLLIPGQTVYNYTPKDPMLIPGQSYALRVQAIDPLGEITFDNEGWSPVRKFLYEGCPPIGNISYAWQDTVLTVRVTAPQTNVHRYYAYSILKLPNDSIPISQQTSVYNPSAYFSNVLGTINASPKADGYTINVTGYCDNNLVSPPTVLALQPLDQCPSLGRIKTEWRDSVLVITPDKSPFFTKFDLSYRPKSKSVSVVQSIGTYYGNTLMVSDFYRSNRADSTYEFTLTATCVGGKQSQQTFLVQVPRQLNRDCPPPKLKESRWIDSTLVVTLDTASMNRVNYQNFSVTYRKANANLVEGPFLPGPIRIVNLYSESLARTNVTVSITAGCPKKLTSLPLTFDTTIPNLSFADTLCPTPVLTTVTPQWLDTTLYLPVSANPLYQSFSVTAQLTTYDVKKEGLFTTPKIMLKQLHKAMGTRTAPVQLAVVAGCANNRRSRALVLDVQRPTTINGACPQPGGVQTSWENTTLTLAVRPDPKYAAFTFIYPSSQGTQPTSYTAVAPPYQSTPVRISLPNAYVKASTGKYIPIKVVATCLNNSTSDTLKTISLMNVDTTCKAPVVTATVWAVDSSLRLTVQPSIYYQSFAVNYQRPGQDSSRIQRNILSASNPIIIPKFFTKKMATQVGKRVSLTLKSLCSNGKYTDSTTVNLVVPARLSADTLLTKNRVKCRPIVNYDCANPTLIPTNPSTTLIQADSLQAGYVVALNTLDLKITQITINQGGTSFNGQGIIKVPAIQFVSEAREVQVAFTLLKVNDAYCVTGGTITPARDPIAQQKLKDSR